MIPPPTAVVSASTHTPNTSICLRMAMRIAPEAAKATVPISSRISTNPSMRASPVSVLQRIIYQGWRARKHPGDEKIKEIRGLCRMVIIWAVKLKKETTSFLSFLAEQSLLL